MKKNPWCKPHKGGLLHDSLTPISHCVSFIIVHLSFSFLQGGRGAARIHGGDCTLIQGVPGVMTNICTGDRKRQYKSKFFYTHLHFSDYLRGTLMWYRPIHFQFLANISLGTHCRAKLHWFNNNYRKIIYKKCSIHFSDAPHCFGIRGVRMFKQGSEGGYYQNDAMYQKNV